MNTDKSADTLPFKDLSEMTELELRDELRYWRVVRAFWLGKDFESARILVNAANGMIDAIIDQIAILKCN